MEVREDYELHATIEQQSRGKRYEYLMVGTADQIADEMRDWVKRALQGYEGTEIRISTISPMSVIKLNKEEQHG